jgi:hypothetical protein
MHTTDECHSHADFEYLRLRPVTVCLELAPVRPVHGAFHDAPHASAIRSRSLEEVFSPTSGRDFENLFSSGSPLTSLSPHWLAHHARATVGSSSAEIAFPALPVKRERLARPEMSSIEDDAGRPATQPFRATPVFRENDLAVLPPRFAFRRHFARRGLPLWASPRSFELIPVREWRARPSLGTTSSFDFCNTTRSTDTPRDSFESRACAGRSQTRSPRSPPPVKARTVFPRLRAAPPVPFEIGPLRDCPCGRAPAEGTESEGCLVH